VPLVALKCIFCDNNRPLNSQLVCLETETEGNKYTRPEIAFSRSIFDFIMVSDVNSDAEMLWSLLNGFIFLNEPLHRHAHIWSQDVGIITTRRTGPMGRIPTHADLISKLFIKYLYWKIKIYL